MTAREKLALHRSAILEIAERHGAENARLFGSLERGDDGPQSDVDVLGHMAKGRNFIDFVAFRQDVEELLDGKVDVVSDGGIKPPDKGSCA
ncbi:MAG: nucleotidyltransferase domain-containing protein [bacterium]|jgi:hypothetical protein